MMRVLYKYQRRDLAEPYLRKIEAEDFEVSVAPTFQALRRLIEAIGPEVALIVIEEAKQDFQQALNWVKDIAISSGHDMTTRVAILVLFTTTQPEAVSEMFESAGAFCMIRRDTDALLERLHELRRFLRRIYSKAQIRITVSVTGEVRVWMLGRDRQEHEFILSAKLKQLVVFLGVNRYADKYRIAKHLGIHPRSVKMYVNRLRSAYERFNADELHLTISGMVIFQMLNYPDGHIYRIRARVTIDQGKPPGGSRAAEVFK